MDIYLVKIVIIPIIIFYLSCKLNSFMYNNCNGFLTTLLSRLYCQNCNSYLFYIEFLFYESVYENIENFNT